MDDEILASANHLHENALKCHLREENRLVLKGYINPATGAMHLVDFKWISSGFQVDFKWNFRWISSGFQVDFK